METIKIYIENIFRGLPETDEIRRARNELGAVMEDKYNELKASGKSENEAIGIVISEFGNIDELIGSIGISDGTPDDAAKKTVPVPTAKLVEKETVSNYLNVVRKNALRIPLGIFITLSGVVVMILFSGIQFDGIRFDGIDVMENRAALGLVFMLVMIIAGVMIIVFNALQLNEYTMFNVNFRLTRDAEHYATEAYKVFAPKKIRLITTGICIILVSVLAVIISAMFTEESASVAGVCIMLVLIGIGIMPLVYAGMFITAFDKILQRQEVEMTQMKKSERIISAIAGAYWCFVIAAYLLVSLIIKRWDLTWIFWPVAALIFGGIAAFISMTVKD